MICPECGGEVIIAEVPYYYRKHIYLGEFEAEICKKCGATYFKEKSFIEIERRAKILRIWGRKIIPTEEKLTIAVESNIPTVDVRQIFESPILDMKETLTVGV